MTLRKGIVVATHPEDHSVDLVMSDTGARLTGVQVQTANGSTRTGSVDMPHVPEKANKWDISKETDQEMIALVATVGRQPVVTGFLYPQINQMLSKDPKRMVARHQSDVQWGIDGEGNIQLDHPSGTYIRIGEAADREDTEGKNADGTAKADRNTGRKVNIRIGLAGNVCVVTMTPEGAVTFKMEQDFTIESAQSIRMKAAQDIVMEAGGEIRAVATGDAKINGANVRLNEG